MSETERQSTASGLAWEVVANNTTGFRCGYVQIPGGHPLFGLDYSDVAPGILMEDLAEEPIGKRGIISLICASNDKGARLDILFDVHGSLTFAGPRHAKDDWWLGFDCGHSGDGKDAALMDARQNSIYARYGFSDGPVRTADYVEAECVSLAAQIVARWPLSEVPS